MNYSKHIITLGLSLFLSIFILGINTTFAAKVPKIILKNVFFPPNISIGEKIVVTGYLETENTYEGDLEAEINYMILPESDAEKVKGRSFSKIMAHLTKDIIIHRLHQGGLYYFEQEVEITAENFRIIKDIKEIKPNNVVMIWPTNVKIKGGDEIIPEQIPIILSQSKSFNNPKTPKKPSVDIIEINFPKNVAYGEPTKVTGTLRAIGLQKEKIDNLELEYVIKTANGPKKYKAKCELLKAKGKHLFYFEQEIVIDESNFKITRGEIKPTNVVMIWPTNVKVIDGGEDNVPPFEEEIVINAGGSTDDNIVGSEAPIIKTREKSASQDLKERENDLKEK